MFLDLSRALVAALFKVVVCARRKTSLLSFETKLKYPRAQGDKNDVKALVSLQIFALFFKSSAILHNKQSMNFIKTRPSLTLLLSALKLNRVIVLVLTVFHAPSSKHNTQENVCAMFHTYPSLSQASSIDCLRYVKSFSNSFFQFSFLDL